MRDPPHRRPVNLPGWNDRAAVALLVLVAGHLHAAEPASAARPLTPDRLARVVAGHDLPALVAVCEGSPSEPARHGAQQLRRLLRAGQAQVYQRILTRPPRRPGRPLFSPRPGARRRQDRPRPLPAGRGGTVTDGAAGVTWPACPRRTTWRPK